MTTPSTDVPLDSDLGPDPIWRAWAVRIVVLLLAAGVVIYAANLGLRFRHWMWESTVPIRYTSAADSNIERDFHWGREAAIEGYANQYEKMQPERPGDQQWLDSAPLRLGLMTLWAKWAVVHYPQVKRWDQHPTFELATPVLWFNTFMEGIGVVCAFLLTRLWTNRAAAARSPFIRPHSSFFRGWIPGLFAAAILWFNPAIVLSAYGWPTWDLWIIPMFLLAALLASLDWWFTAGIVLGIGAMLNGQQLLAVPVFLAWALIIGRPISAMRMLAGLTIAIAIVASPWLLTYIPADKLAAARAIQSERQPALVPEGTFAIPRVVDVWAIVWIIGLMLAAIAGPFVARLRLRGPQKMPLWRHLMASQWTFPAVAVIGTFLLVSWPWMLKVNRQNWLIGECAGVALATATRWLRPRGIPFVAAGAVGAAMLLCMSVFHGFSAWYDCGIHFGTVHRPVLTVGKPDNLPAILRDHYDWSDDLATTGITLPAHSVFSFWSRTEVNVSEGSLLRGIFLFLLGLIAIVTPWLMFFCFAPQIDERYLLFAAGISCICAGISTGMTLLGVLLSIVTAVMTLQQMLGAASRANLQAFGNSLHQQFPSIFDRDGGQLLLRIADGTHPDLGFAVVLIGFIFLYFTLAMRKPD
jgi:hypothetical protein